MNRHSQFKWVKIEEGKTGSGFGTPISVYIFAIPAQISNVSPSYVSFICVVGQ